MKRKEFVVEKYNTKKKEWVFHSDHNNECNALSNLEAISKKVKVRIFQNGKKLCERK